MQNTFYKDDRLIAFDQEDYHYVNARLGSDNIYYRYEIKPSNIGNSPLLEGSYTSRLVSLDDNGNITLLEKRG